MNHLRISYVFVKYYVCIIYVALCIYHLCNSCLLVMYCLCIIYELCVCIIYVLFMYHLCIIYI